jgi:hypothetical protein
MAESITTLDAAAEAFYRELPPADYPTALIERFPRIANQIVSLRGNKTRLHAYFNSLLNDDRGGRQGFPFPVLANIQNLFDILIGIPDGFVDTDLIYSGANKPKDPLADQNKSAAAAQLRRTPEQGAPRK